MNSGYPTNLTDNQWQILQKILEPTPRKRKYSLRDIVDCILYINKTGCQWRMTPKDFPPYNLVFYYFTKWKREGVFEDIMDTLREKLRVSLGRDESPSLGIIDSRSAKTTQHVDKERGVDGNKKVKGRKNQVVVDTLGLPMAVSVHEANIHDSKGAESALSKIAYKFPRLKKIIADGGYRGDELKEKVRRTLGCKLEIVLRPDESPKKFNVIPLRWIVERSFAWLYNFRRIALDYEFYSDSSEAMIQIAFAKIMLNKLSN
jgi:putative transposase